MNYLIPWGNLGDFYFITLFDVRCWIRYNSSMDQLQNKLIEYGLHEYEARLYLSAMELGPSPVQQIAKKAGINRVSAYNFIKTLIDKGLMSTYEEGKKTMYVASAPENLASLFEYQRREIEAKKEDLQKLLPEFRSKYNVGEGKPVVRYYEGIDGVVNMNREIFESGYGEMLTAYDLDTTRKYFPEELRKKLLQDRVGRNLKIKIIYTSKSDKIVKRPLAEIYRIEDPNYPLIGDILIFGDRVRFVSFSEKLSGIVIEDRQVAQTLRSIFQIACNNIGEQKE